MPYYLRAEGPRIYLSANQVVVFANYESGVDILPAYTDQGCEQMVLAIAKE